MNCTICGYSSQPIMKILDITLYRCKNCGHCFQDRLSEYNKMEYNEDYFEKEHPNWFNNPNIKLFEKVFDIISNGINISKQIDRPTIIDVGCGRGDLLRYLKKKNLNRVCSLLGLDLLENTSEEGITFIKGDIQETDIQEHYDYVINTATIEHIEDIHLFVDNLIRLCKPSSKIILMTINENGYIYLLARILYKMGIPFAAKRLYYGSKHINHFSLRSLTYLLEMKGLKINEIVHHNYPLSAVDLPPCSKTTAFFCKLGILFLFITGSITKRASSVTVVCEIK